MLVSSVSQHIWSLKLRKEDGSALKCMSGLRAGVWWVRLEVLINHTEPFSAFSLSFISLCRSGDRSGVTLSCNKCFEGRRPDIVFEITRPVCVCSHTAAVILGNWPFVRLLHILHYSYSLAVQEDQNQPFLSLSPSMSPKLATKTELIFTQWKCSRVCQQLTVLTAVRYLLLSYCTPDRLTIVFLLSLVLWSHDLISASATNSSAHLTATK